MDINREKAAKFGIDVSIVGNFIKLVTNGLIATTYRPNDSDDEVDILLRFPKEYRNISRLDQLRAITDEGSVPVSNFVERTATAKN